MENASEALLMAFAVLVFVVALSISIYSFGQARATSEFIIEKSDSSFDYTYVESSDTRRTVRAETIIPTLYRMYKENLVIVFENCGNVFSQKINNVETDYNKIDLQTLNIGTEEEAIEFIRCLLYGTKDNNNLLNGFGSSNIYSNKLNTSLFDIINSNNFTESIGIYYIEDVGENAPENISDVNKTKKRIITYTQTKE